MLLLVGYHIRNQDHQTRYVGPAPDQGGKVRTSMRGRLPRECMQPGLQDDWIRVFLCPFLSNSCVKRLRLTMSPMC
jgi:hypothetical protein